MLRGLSKSERRDDARRVIVRWVEEKLYLRHITWYLSSAEDFDAGLLEKALKAALENDDDAAVLNALRTAVARHMDHPDGLVDTIFIPAHTHFMAKKDTQWVNAAWHDPKNKSIFRDLRPEQADAVLESLISHPRIEYRVEEILTSIAETWPEKVFDFFRGRLEVVETPNSNARYEAIPFKLHSLHKPLSNIPDYVIDTARTWFTMDRSLFEFRGGKLVSIIFPKFSDELKNTLLSLIRSGDPKDIEFVIKVLRTYEGQTFLHGVCKEIVKALPPDDPLLNEVEIILDSTGVVSGSFGFVTAYRRKKTEIEPWLDDANEKVRSFAERHLLSLDRQIAAEQRTSEERLEMRKRNYGEEGGEEN